jgi:hypothetical protein
MASLGRLYLLDAEAFYYSRFHVCYPFIPELGKLKYHSITLVNVETLHGIPSLDIVASIPFLGVLLRKSLRMNYSSRTT